MTDGRPERGLLMTGPLVMQTIEGRKTETRRVGDRYRKWKRGDIVYVRETWAHGTQPNQVFYRANRKPGHANTLRWRPSIHMPKWAARVWLELTADVTYEPLHNITEDDAIAEGVAPSDWPDEQPLTCGPRCRCTGCYVRGGRHRAAFALLWDQINGGRDGDLLWFDNPEVAVIRYRVISTTGRPS